MQSLKTFYHYESTCTRNLLVTSMSAENWPIIWTLDILYAYIIQNGSTVFTERARSNHEIREPFGGVTFCHYWLIHCNNICIYLAFFVNFRSNWHCLFNIGPYNKRGKASYIHLITLTYVTHRDSVSLKSAEKAFWLVEW